MSHSQVCDGIKDCADGRDEDSIACIDSCLPDSDVHSP